MNEDFCEMQCYLEPNCVSYNFKNSGEHKCDLNNATYEHDNERSGDLEKNDNYVYRGAEVSLRFKSWKYELKFEFFNVEQVETLCGIVSWVQNPKFSR